MSPVCASRSDDGIDQAGSGVADDCTYSLGVISSYICSSSRIDETDSLSLVSVVAQAVYLAKTAVFEELRAAVPMNESMIKNEKHIILHGTTFQEVTPDPVDNSGPSLMIARIREVWKMIKLHQFLVKENQYQGSYYYQNGLLRRRLNINLFSVGSNFVMADLEVAFRKSTCYIRDLKGNDLLTGSPWHRIVFQFSCKSHLLPIHLLKAKSNIVYNMVNGIVVYLIKLRHHQLLSKNNIVNGPFQN
ncbi:hypothetical protein Tco_0764518 [Tanacetum coccineum]